MVRFIPAIQTLELRSTQLRNGKARAECVFDTDHVEGSFHLGCFYEDTLVGVASFFPKKYKDNPGPGYQLRGMATAPGYEGKGFGRQIIDFAATQLQATTAQYLWCNARISAVGFYKKSGFELVSAEFEIPGVGPHYEMILKINTRYEDNRSI